MFDPEPGPPSPDPLAPATPDPVSPPVECTGSEAIAPANSDGVAHELPPLSDPPVEALSALEPTELPVGPELSESVAPGPELVEEAAEALESSLAVGTATALLEAPPAGLPPIADDGWMTLGMLPFAQRAVEAYQAAEARRAAERAALVAETSSSVAELTDLPTETQEFPMPADEFEAGLEPHGLGDIDSAEAAIDTLSTSAAAPLGENAPLIETGAAKRERISDRIAQQQKKKGGGLRNLIGLVVAGILGLMLPYYLISLIGGPQYNFLRLKLPGLSVVSRSSSGGSSAPRQAAPKPAVDPGKVQEGSAFPDFQKLRELEEQKAAENGKGKK